MKKITFLTILTMIFLSNTKSTFAQDVSFEKVKEICKDTPRESRTRVTVIRFSSSMRGQNYNQLGEELASMLENALYKVNCFNVLASSRDKSDFDAEFSWTNNGYANNTGAQKGNMLGAQAIITGEITEYAEGGKKTNAFGVSVSKSQAHVGFILKVLNPLTRETLFSESIDMEGKSTGFNGVSLLGINVAGNSNRSKALNDAVEKAIIKATEVLAKTKDNWGLTDDSNNSNMSRLLVSMDGADFTSLMQITNQLKTQSGVESAEMNMSEGIGYINVISALSNQDLAVKLNSIANGFDIIGLDNGGVQMKKKE